MELETAQQQQRDAVLAGYQIARWGTPVNITLASGVTATFTGSPAMQENLSQYAIVHLAAPNPSAQMPLQDANDTTQILTWVDLQNLIQTFVDRSTAVWIKQKTLLGQIDAATRVEAVQQIQW